MTKQQLRDDLILRITKGKPSDDLELEKGQVEFWIDSVLNALVVDSLNAKLKDKGDNSIDPVYICYERLVPIRQNSQVYANNFYVDLCDEPLNLYRDRGVIRVATEPTATEPGQGVDKMKMEEIDDLRNLKYSRPSLKNLKYHRVKKRLWFHGLTADTFNLVTFLIAFVPKLKALEDLKDTDSIPVSDDLIPQIAEEVEKIARRQVYQSDEDDSNNSEQDLNVNGQ